MKYKQKFTPVVKANLNQFNTVMNSMYQNNSRDESLLSNTSATNPRIMMQINKNVKNFADQNHYNLGT